MTAYYNEIDPYAAQWLRNLIDAGLIAPGHVDERSILDVSPDDLASFTQCHFFAGIGVWSYALRRAGWQDSRPVWTGSCPCQPFSVAGVGRGVDDERHLWPFWFHLIEQCRPRIVFGEQVEAAIKHGWLDLVQTDLEGIGYAFAAVGLPAAGVGAPHIRQRLWFVANADGVRCKPTPGAEFRPYAEHDAESFCAAGRLVYTDGEGLEGLRNRHQAEEEWRGALRPVAETGEPGGFNASQTNGFWRAVDWLSCRDGRWRPVEPGTFPLAHGTAARVGRLRAYGNSIVAPVAEEVIKAYMECRP